MPSDPRETDCQGASIYIDTILRPFVMTFPSYLRDTKDTVTKLHEIVIQDCVLLASLVESLYTNIMHDLGINAIKYFLDTRSIYLQGHNKFVFSLLSFVLTQNYFLFDGTFYHQKCGTAMGTRCALTYANLFLGWWANCHFFTESMSNYMSHIIFSGQYIDNVLLLWDGERTLFNEFVHTLSENSIGMHFTSEIHEISIHFLDLTISWGGDGSVVTKVFRKPTATNSFLHWGRYHPLPLRRGITIGQYLLAKRNCTDQ